MSPCPRSDAAKGTIGSWPLSQSSRVMPWRRSGPARSHVPARSCLDTAPLMNFARTALTARRFSAVNGACFGWR